MFICSIQHSVFETILIHSGFFLQIDRLVWNFEEVDINSKIENKLAQ